MKVSLGSDHAGLELKTAIKDHLEKSGYEVIDEGTFTSDSCDYSDFASKVAHDVIEGRAEFGILCCGTGEGISIAANKIKGIRCGIGYDKEVTRLTREHNNANMIAFGARFMKEDDVIERVDVFLSTPFAGGRHQRRIDKIDELEK